MHKQTYQEQDMRYSVIIALLIHILLLLILFFFLEDGPLHMFSIPDQESLSITFEEEPPTPQKPLEPQQEHEVAALKPRAGTFGVADQEAESPFFSGKQEQDTETQTVQKPEEAAQESQQSQEPGKAETIPLSEAHSPLVEKNIAESLSKKSEAPQEKEGKKQEDTLISSPPKKDTPSISAGPMKRDISFKDLASGFLSSWQNDGNDWCERKGNENIRPDMEEMRYHSYLQKVAWHIQNMWRTDQTFRTVAPESTVVTAVRIRIDKAGNLQEATLLSSCGLPALDEAVLRGIKAVGSYPPVPNYLKKDEVVFEFGVKFLGQKRSPFSFYGL